MCLDILDSLMASIVGQNQRMAGHCRIGENLDIANSAAFAAHPCRDLLTKVAKESKHLVS